MNKRILPFLIYLFFGVSSLFAQSYSIEGTIGGTGNIGEQVIIDARTATATFGNSFYFLNFKVRKEIIQTTKSGIVEAKFRFPFFSKTVDFDDIENFSIDKLGRFIIHQEAKNIILCFNRDGTLVYQTKEINSYSPDTYKVSFGFDSKNNLYLGCANQILIFDDKGNFQSTFGKKGTANGEFNNNVRQIFIDDEDNLCAVSSDFIQFFDKSLKFISKFANFSPDDILFDGKETFYAGSKFSHEIEIYNKTGKVIKTVKVGDFFETHIADMIGFNGLNPVFSYDKFYFKGYFATYDLTSNKLIPISISTGTQGGVGSLIDFQFDKKGNNWVLDRDKIQSFLPDNTVQHFSYEPNNLNFNDIRQLVDISDNGDLLCQIRNGSSNTLKVYNVNTKSVNQVFSFKATDEIKYMKVDSLNKEILAMSSNFYGTGKIELYGFDGTSKKTILNSNEIEAMCQHKNGNFYVISRENYNFLLNIYDTSGNLLKVVNLPMFEFEDSILGVVFDDENIMHLAIRHTKNGNGKGMSIYAFNDAGNLLASKLNLADNVGNFIEDKSFLLKKHNGMLYFGDIIGGQIFKLWYSANDAVKRIATINASNINKVIGDPNFMLQSNSNSNAPFVYNILSGDAIKLSADGKIEILKAGEVSIKISQAENLKFQAAEKIVKISIVLSPSSIQISNINKVATDPDFMLEPTSNSNAPFIYSVLSGDAVKLNENGKVEILKAGKVSIKISQAENLKFQTAEKIVQISIVLSPSSIKISNINKVATDLDFMLEPTSNSNAPFIYSVLNGDAVKLNENGKIEILKAGKVSIKISQAENFKYQATEKTVEISIALSPSTIKISSFNKVIGDADFMLEPTSNSNAPFVYSVLSGDAVKLNENGEIEILKAGEVSIKISQAENLKFQATEKIVQISVVLKSTKIELIAPITKLINDVAFTLVPVSNSSQVFEFNIKNGDAVTVDSKGLVKILKAGNAVISITQEANNQFMAAKIEVEISVKKLSQTINFTALSAEIFSNGPEIDLVAKSTSNLIPSFRILSGPGKLNGTKLLPTGSQGLIVIEAFQEGNDLYGAAPVVTQSVKVILVLGIENENETQIAIYPNPSSDFIQIESKTQFNTYQIIDMTGKVLNNENLNANNQIGISTLIEGTYILRLFKENQNLFNKRFIKLK